MEKQHFIQLIDKYLSGTATDAEQRLVEEYMRRLEAKDNISLDPEQEQQLKEVMWQQIQQQTTQQPGKVVQISWYKSKIVRLTAAVAAAIVLVILIGTLFTNEKPDEQSVDVQNGNKRSDITATFVRHEVNTSGKEKRVQLPDGSMVVLADKSEITYREPFTNRRDITLIGKAYFKVAKDNTKPFTVISGDISTTALGTEFTVTAFEKANRITVRLYEGKVVVKSVKNGNRNLRRDVYLLPGQEFVYDSKTTAKVTTFKMNGAASPEVIMNEELARDNPSIPQNTEGSWYMFNNQSLEQVLDQLAALYSVEIVYDKRDVQNIYFTGKYNRSDSLEMILKRIGILNNLTITRKDNAFIISK
ncbi:MAG: FecR family protein [Flavisolibacter sp.]|nr:FecR family protein [Flavisolibacter sp.]